MENVLCGTRRQRRTSLGNIVVTQTKELFKRSVVENSAKLDLFYTGV
jgi:hypothetical protein